MINFRELNKTIYSTFSSILPLYIEGCIPKKAKLPYMVYGFTVSKTFYDSLLNIKIYCKESDYTDLFTFGSKIEDVIGHGLSKDFNNGKGKICLRKGDPFSQVYTEEDDIQCMYFNIIMQVF